MAYYKNLVLFLILIITLVSCVNCKKLATYDKEEECLLIVGEFPKTGEAFFDYKGVHPYSGKRCDCKSETSYRWWNLYTEHIELGDTIIKEKGELTFNIHKKDTILSFNWECESKVYK